MSENFDANDEDDFMAELKQEFIESTAANLIELQSLLQKKEFPKIAKIAHDIKGTSGVFGFENGSEIAKELQTAAQNSEEEKVVTLIAKLSEYMHENGIGN
jgi:HPt (histidine-containing phosphotransfer) domain-containing protein